MSVADTVTLVHLPFAVREGYGNPEPEGLAVGHADMLGDASGGNAIAALQTDGGFLYRLEMLNATKGSAVVNGANTITSHRWASHQSGFANDAFTLNWIPEQATDGVFSTYNLFPGDLTIIRRFPLGRTEQIPLFAIATFTWVTNEDTIVYDVDWIFSYWKVEALYRPGFLAAFYEAPFVPQASR